MKKLILILFVASMPFVFSFATEQETATTQTRQELAAIIAKQHEFPVVKQQIGDITDSRLLRRSKRYSSDGRRVSLRKGGLTDNVTYITVAQLPPLPVSDSDVIARVLITNFQPYFSQDESKIWTDFEVQVREIFYSAPGLVLRAGDIIKVERSGGAILTSEGITYRERISDRGMPRIGEDYGVKTRLDLMDFRRLPSFFVNPPVLHQ